MTGEEAPRAILALITGEVQGVWFRAWTVQEAGKRGITGWVRNLRDGSVEALFCGPRAALDDMLAACREGPPLARVENIELEDADPPAEARFVQAPTHQSAAFPE